VRDTLANLTAAIHLAYFLAVVAGFGLIAFDRRSARNLWFRVCHLIAITIVVVEDAGAFNCPLNTFEWGLRASTTGTREASSGIGGVLDGLLFHSIPGWILNDLWWGFAALAVVLMVLRPPRYQVTHSENLETPPR
jgi:hypothetical protein